MAQNKKLYIVFVFVLIIVLAFSCWINFRDGIYIGDRFFYIVDDTLYKNNKDNNISLQENDDSTEFDIYLDREHQNANIRWESDKAIITYDDNTVIEGTWDGDWLWGNDEIPILPETLAVVGDERPQIDKITIGYALCKIDRHETSTRGSVGIMIFGAVAYLLGALAFIFPNKVHFFMRKWAYKNAELSDSGVLAEKIASVIIMLAGIVLMLGLFIYP